MNKKVLNIISRIIIGIAVVLGTAAVLFLFWWKGGIRPGWINWQEKSATFEKYNVVLEDRGLSVYDGSYMIFDRVWKSDWDWSVQDFFVTDVNEDGIDELIMLVWKRGSYGEHMPFWEERNDTNLKQHIFIYTYDEKEDRVRAIWMSSEIAYDIENFEEGPNNSIKITKLAGQTDVWRWEEWGLKYWCDEDTLSEYMANIARRDEAAETASTENEQENSDSNATGTSTNSTEALAKLEDEELDETNDIKSTEVTDSDESVVHFVAVGDNLIHPGICSYGNKNNFEFDYFYENVKDTIEGADLAAINQETIFVKEPSEVSNYPAFGTIVNLGNAIYNAGFDIVSIANNHTLDKRMYGIDTTAEFYDSLPKGSITYTGIHPSWEENTQDPESGIKVVERNGIKFALLSLTYDTNGIPSPKDYPYCVERFDNEERTLKQLKMARQMGDVVIVFAHWGTEYSQTVDAYQKKWRDIMLENGVDVVVGSHPHVLQDYELLTGEDGHQMLVYYSLGNFISGQFKPECLIGGIAEFDIIKDSKGSITIGDYGMRKVETRHSNGIYSVYYLDEEE